MTEINKKILDLILNECSLDTLVKETGLTHKQVYSRLKTMKNSGYQILNKYYDCGSISYSLQKGFINEQTQSEGLQVTTIFTKPNSQNFEAVLISDTHLGNELDRIDLLKVVYDFCTKNNINIIINSGDFLDGTFGRSAKKVQDSGEQVSYALKNHPYDNHILNFICLGNHDVSILKKNGINISETLNKRFDLIPIGYGIGQINVKNDYFFVRHPLGVVSDNSTCILSKKLVINGHIHQAKVNNYNPDMNIYLPTLSDIMFEKSGMPGFFKMNIECQKGYFVKIQLDHYIINCLKPIKVNEFNMQFNNGHEIDVASRIQNERFVPTTEKRALEQNEEFFSQLIKTPMSQIEKFNARYKK